jgi:hypothetical protein
MRPSVVVVYPPLVKDHTSLWQAQEQLTVEDPFDSVRWRLVSSPSLGHPPVVVGDALMRSAVDGRDRPVIVWHPIVAIRH